MIIRENARLSALNDFGWDENDICDAKAKLRRRHFFKSEESKQDMLIFIDYYKARGLGGEDVYTHFHIDEGRLFINSFKKLEV